MIAGIYGKISNILPGEVYINTNSGVIYLVNISLNTFKDIKDKREVELITEYVFSETSQKLYGFSCSEEHTLFKILIKIPKVAHTTSLNICSGFSLKDLYSIVSNNDAKALSQIKGLGLKSATNIIHYLTTNNVIESITDQDIIDNSLLKGIKASMTALGFKESQYKESLKDIDQELTLEKNIKILIKKVK